MRTIIICSGGEDGKDVRTAIRIEDELFEKMFGSHIKDAMSFDEVELYFEGYVDRLKATCNGQNIDMNTMATRIKSLEDELDRSIERYLKHDCEIVNSEEPTTELRDKIQDLENRLEDMAKQRDHFKDELDIKDKEIEYLKGTVVKARPVDCFKYELEKRDKEIEQLKEAVVRANENADSYYKLYSSERDAHKKASAMVDDLNTDFLEAREIVTKKCEHWSHTIWDSVNSLSEVSKDEKINSYSGTMILRNIANDISDFGANDAEGLMEEYEKEEEESEE